MKKKVNWKLIVDEIDFNAIGLDTNAIDHISYKIINGHNQGEVEIVLPELTEEDKKKYITNGGNSCPWCGDKDIIGDSFDTDNNYITQLIRCQNCDHSWYDIYKLTGIDVVN